MIEENDQLDPWNEEAGNASSEESETADTSEVTDDQLDGASGGRAFQ